ncbi:MAG TPA: sigma-70 family RNA polymerase sigma factor [Acidimicrobiales bacterium]|jgi:RNA polymerase sigma-70 factor (sigma-E family)|nr:sigma-70 family RNA polymerase sigma factor [Acidimicrobiales bacterium]
MRLKVMPTLAVRRPADLGELHRERYAAMVRLATLLVGSQAVAEEVVQDCFVRLHTRFDGLDDPAAYLRRAVVNGCRSVGRRRALELRRLRAARPAVAELGADEMLDALAKLPARQRAALVLRFYEELPAAQIALALGCRPGTVKSLIHRGLAELRKGLEP